MPLLLEGELGDLAGRLVLAAVGEAVSPNDGLPVQIIDIDQDVVDALCSKLRRGWWFQAAPEASGRIYLRRYDAQGQPHPVVALSEE